MRDLSGSVGPAGAVPPIRGGKCHLWCLAPGQRIYGRWRALVRRARRLAVGPAAGIRYYPLEDKGVLVTTIPPAEMSDSVSHSRMSDLMALTISHLCLSALPRRERSGTYHCSACASLSQRRSHQVEWQQTAKPNMATNCRKSLDPHLPPHIGKPPL